MTKKEKFIKIVEDLFTEVNDIQDKEIDQDAWDYLETLKTQKTKTRSVEITENGKAILEYMQGAIEEFDNNFLSKEIAEGLFTSSRSVSGAMRKLVTDDFVEKSEDSPIIYSLSEKGKDFKIEG